MKKFGVIFLSFFLFGCAGGVIRVETGGSIRVGTQNGTIFTTSSPRNGEFVFADCTEYAHEAIVNFEEYTFRLSSGQRQRITLSGPNFLGEHSYHAQIFLIEKGVRLEPPVDEYTGRFMVSDRDRSPQDFFGIAWRARVDYPPGCGR